MAESVVHVLEVVEVEEQHGHPGAGTLRPRDGGGEPVGEEHAVGTVSYTHLRAHETVLDLVCRLLLEKKKNKNRQKKK